MTYGPPTTRKLSGAGCALSDWDEMIDRALRHGDTKLASDLRDRRAKVNLATGYLEPVFVPDALGRAIASHRSGLLRTEPSFTVSAVPEPAAIARKRA